MIKKRIDGTDDQNFREISYVPTPLEKTASDKSKRYVIGKDDRVVWPSQAVFPGAAVGRVVLKNGAVCSGALVGPRHVLTARHCLDAPGPAMFQPGYDQGEKHGMGRITATLNLEVPHHEGTECEWQNDWAVLVLDQRLGDKIGYFGVGLPDPSKFDQPLFTHQAYPGDKNPAGERAYRETGTVIHSNSSLSCDNTGPLKSDTDTYYGQGGGPIWETGGGDDGFNIWGVLSRATRTEEWTYAGWASGLDMVRAVEDALERWA